MSITAKIKAAFRKSVSDSNQDKNINFVEPKNPYDIEIGMYVIDQKTGLQGWVVCRRETLSRMVQYAVQRKTPKGMPMLDPEFTDWNNLEYAEGIEKLNVIPPKNVHYLSLGDWAREPLSGAEGVIVEKIIHSSGCVTVELEYNDKDGKPLKYHIHAIRLEKLDKEPYKLPGIPDTPAPAEIPPNVSTYPEPTPMGTGGPGGRMTRL